MEATLNLLITSLASVGVPQDLLYQIGYYMPNFDDSEVLSEAADARWTRSRRTEMVRVYPGREEAHEAVYYVAHSRTVIKGLEVEMIHPLTEPSYIGVLGLETGQVAHLGVKSERFDDDDDMRILRRFSRLGPTLIQKGEVRAGRKTTECYAIYQLDDFLPVKIVRKMDE